MQNLEPLSSVVLDERKRSTTLFLLFSVAPLVAAFSTAGPLSARRRGVLGRHVETIGLKPNKPNPEISTFGKNVFSKSEGLFDHPELKKIALVDFRITISAIRSDFR